jgi:hypothetical protein
MIKLLQTKVEKMNLNYGIFIFFISTAYILINFGSIQSASIDFGDHYVYIQKIIDTQNFSLVNYENLGFMSGYPKVAYVLAAFLSLFFGSTIYGMQFLILLSVCMLWAAIIFMIKELPIRHSITTLFMMTLLFLINKNFIHLEIFGFEVKDSFFFAHFISQALLIVILSIALKMEKEKISPQVVIGLLGIFVVLLDKTHLLSALELFLTLFLIVITNHFIFSRQYSKLAAGKFFIDFLIIIFLLIFFYQWSSLPLMSQISNHNGGLELGISNIEYLVTLSFLLFFESMLIIIWHIKNKSFLSYKYFGSLGISISFLVLFQSYLFFKGFGSHYAVKKYGFGLFTLLIVNTSLVFSELFFKKVRNYLANLSKLFQIQFVLFLILFSFILFYQMNFKEIISTKIIHSYEKALSPLKQFSLENNSNKVSIIKGLDNVPEVVDYMFSSSILHTQREILLKNIFGMNITETYFIDNIFTSYNSNLFHENCIESKMGSNIVRLNYTCFLAGEKKKLLAPE